jgi:hypothetical protein
MGGWGKHRARERDCGRNEGGQQCVFLGGAHKVKVKLDQIPLMQQELFQQLFWSVVTHASHPQSYRNLTGKPRPRKLGLSPKVHLAKPRFALAFSHAVEASLQ